MDQSGESILALEKSTLSRWGDGSLAAFSKSLQRCSEYTGRSCMPTTKDEVRKLVEQLPEDISWEDVQYSIYVRERVERGRLEAAQGKVLEHENVEERMRRFLTD